MFEARSLRAKLGLQLLVSALALPFLVPIVVMIQGSLAGQGLENYRAVFRVPGLGLFFRNSAWISTATVASVYFLSMLAAFGFAKLRVRRREVYFWMMIVALTLPEVVLLAPLFVTSLRLGLYDSHFAVIIPLIALQLPFMTLLARNFVSGIPRELFEAAEVDGATTRRLFWSIVLPLSRPIAATIVILTLILSWNNYLLPLVFLPSYDNQTVTLLPEFFIGQYGSDQTKVLASAVITAVPSIAVYLSLQRLFERGLSAGAIK